MAAADILGRIGNTPMVRLRRLPGPASAAVWAKLEGLNPGGSVKDRVALSVVEAAERDGRLRRGGTIVEPTSGNTGIGLAMVAAARGYRLVLTMPENASKERKDIFEAYGATLVTTPAPERMLGAIARAEELRRENPDWFMADQFGNPANPEAHRKGTAVEILRDLGMPDAFVAGVGTGGTITGVGEVLKKERPDTRVVAVEPAGSPILSGGEPGRHRIAGIGAGFFSAVLNTGVYDEVLTVTDEEAFHTARRLAIDEGILAGPSSGAAVHAALRVAERLGEGRAVVVILPDRGDRYLSTGLFTRTTGGTP